jgi:hypothetical protein
MRAAISDVGGLGSPPGPVKENGHGGDGGLACGGGLAPPTLAAETATCG